MNISFVSYTITLYRYDKDEGLLLFSRRTYNKPSNSTILICNLLPNTRFYYELAALKERRNGSLTTRYTVTQTGWFETGSDTLGWEAGCESQRYNVLIEWDFDLSQVLNSDQIDMVWSYRLGDGEPVILDETHKTTTDNIEHYTLYLEDITAGTLYLNGTTANGDYQSISEEITIGGDS